MKYFNTIIISLIILTGLFTYKVGDEVNRFYTAQLAMFILSLGLLGGMILYKKNKWIAGLVIVFAFGVFKTLLLENSPKIFIYGTSLVGMSMFIFYYMIRELKITEDFLKWFLVPACLNILLIFMQAFDHNYIKFMPVEGISGFIGNPGFVSIYLALTLPLFLKYLKLGIPFLLLAIILCDGGVGMIACVVSGLFYLYHTNKRNFKRVSIVTLIVMLVYLPFFFSDKVKHKSELKGRLIYMLGTLDGIKHNPVLGWGVGSFIPTMVQVKPEDSKYLGGRFNTPDTVLNHPHNEFLFGWWNVGIFYIVFVIGYIVSLIKQFNKTKIVSASVIVAGLVAMMGYFLRLPVWFLLIMALGVYENLGGSNGKKKERSCC